MFLSAEKSSSFSIFFFALFTDNQRWEY